MQTEFGIEFPLVLGSAEAVPYADNTFGLAISEHTREGPRATTEDLDKTIARTTDTLADLDSAITRVHRRLEPPRSTESRGKADRLPGV